MNPEIFLPFIRPLREDQALMLLFHDRSIYYFFKSIDHSLIVKKGVVRWRIEVELRMSPSVGTDIAIRSIMPYKLKKNADTGSWMMIWEGTCY